MSPFFLAVNQWAYMVQKVLYNAILTAVFLLNQFLFFDVLGCDMVNCLFKLYHQNSGTQIDYFLGE